MQVKKLKELLERASSMLSAAGAAKQAKSVDAVAAVLDEASTQTVDAYVAETKDALSRPALDQLPASAISAELRASLVDKGRFQHLLAQIEDKSFAKRKAIEVAVLFTGASETAYKSKTAALKAIKRKYDYLAWQEAKSKLNEKVTPW